MPSNGGVMKVDVPGLLVAVCSLAIRPQTVVRSPTSWDVSDAGIV
jgi:hypothetical protein